MFNIFRRELKVIRQGDGRYERGEWKEGNKETFLIKASVQGSDAEVMQTLPEGYRTEECYTLFTDTKLNTSKEKSKPDIVIIDDKNFQVIKVTAWQNLQDINHFEIVVIKENKDAN